MPKIWNIRATKCLVSLAIKTCWESATIRQWEKFYHWIVFECQTEIWKNNVLYRDFKFRKINCQFFFTWFTDEKSPQNNILINILPIIEPNDCSYCTFLRWTRTWFLSQLLLFMSWEHIDNFVSIFSFPICSRCRCTFHTWPLFYKPSNIGGAQYIS